MKIDSFIVNAIKKYMFDRQITAAQFAAEIGISPACAVKWRRVGNGITYQKWDVLFPKIKKYLPKDRIYLDDSGKERYMSSTEHVSNYVFEPKYVPSMVPFISLKHIVRFDNTLGSVMQFGQLMGADMVEYRPKHSNKTGIMAIRIDNRLYDPVLPYGAVLFVCTGDEALTEGCLAIAKDIHDEIFIGRYCKRRDQFAVTDLMSEKPLIIGETESPRKFIDWIFPVLYYEVVTF